MYVFHVVLMASIVAGPMKQKKNDSLCDEADRIKALCQTFEIKLIFC